MTDVTVAMDIEVIIHIFYITLILLVYGYAYHIRNHYLKLSYSIVGILLLFYTLYLGETIFSDITGIYVLPVEIIKYGLWFLSGYFVLLGVYKLWDQ